jgi:hypothetical protein
MLAPYQFTPSEELVRRVSSHYEVDLDEKTKTTLKEIATGLPGFSAEENQVPYLIQECVEGLFANLAQRAAFQKQPHMQITNGPRLTDLFCSEVLYRLRLDPYRARPVYERLYEELVSFAKDSPRERSWGRLVFDNDGLKLELSPLC